MKSETEILNRMKDLEIRLYRLAQERQVMEDAFMRQVADNDAEQSTHRKELDALVKELAAAVAERVYQAQQPPLPRGCND